MRVWGFGSFEVTRTNLEKGKPDVTACENAMRTLASVVFAMCALLGISGVDPASAAKPGGGGGAHSSLIIYSTFSEPVQFYQMYEDGSSKSAALPQGVSGDPSSKAHGGSRWWLAAGFDPDTGFREIFAFRSDGSSIVQLTELGLDGFDCFDQPRWSNDLLDSSMTIQAVRDTDATPGPDTYFVLWLPISGADVAAIESGAEPRLTGADCVPLLETPMAASPSESSVYREQYACSSDPSKFAYVMDNLDTNDSTLWVRTLAANPNDPPIDVAIHTTAAGLKLATYAHDGGRIAFTTVNTSSYGGVWTIKPDGTGLLKVKSNSGTTSYSVWYWSPNSAELLLRIIKARPGDWYYDIGRIPAAGGSITVLTGDLAQTLGKNAPGLDPAYAVAWSIPGLRSTSAPATLD